MYTTENARIRVTLTDDVYQKYLSKNDNDPVKTRGRIISDAMETLSNASAAANIGERFRCTSNDPKLLADTMFSLALYESCCAERLRELADYWLTGREFPLDHYKYPRIKLAFWRAFDVIFPRESFSPFWEFLEDEAALNKGNLSREIVLAQIRFPIKLPIVRDHLTIVGRDYYDRVTKPLAPPEQAAYEFRKWRGTIPAGWKIEIIGDMPSGYI